MRQKVIDRICILFYQQGGEIGSEQFLSFDRPTSIKEIESLTDEQLIELLETNGIFEG